MPITPVPSSSVDPVAQVVAALEAATSDLGTAAATYAAPKGAWSSLTAYAVNAVVTYGGGTYRAKVASTNVTPGTDATKWESWGGGVLTDQGSWVTSAAYVAGDVVTQSGQRYVCRTAQTAGTFAADLAALKWVALDAVTAAASSRQIIAGTGLTGGGDLSVDRTLTVAYGTTSGTAAQGNDSRITGAAQKASNLSDLASASTARTNLGAGSANGLATLDSSTLVPAAQLGTGSADSTKLLAGDRTWAAAVPLAQSGQTPSQAPVTAATAASVGSQAFAARSDHVHPDTHPYALPMDSGTWWRLPFVTVSTSWSGLPGGGTVGFLRFPIGASCSIAAMGIQVNTLQSGGLARLGIYSDNAGAPGTLLKDYGTVATDTTGYKTTGATTALALLPGWVWLTVAMEGTFGAQQFDTLSGPYTYIGAATLGGSSTGYNGSGYAGGGLPGTASTLTSFGPALRTFFPWVQTA